jgi:hypothetical protein
MHVEHCHCQLNEFTMIRHTMYVLERVTREAKMFIISQLLSYTRKSHEIINNA